MWDDALRELFVAKLAETYDAEKQIVEAMPEMIAAAQNEELADGLRTHLEQTKGQMARLEAAAALIGEEKIQDRPNTVMRAIIEEGRNKLNEGLVVEAIDAAMIANSQNIEHAEIASYGTLAAWAEELGHEEARNLLHQSLEEEKTADQMLSKIGEREINHEADL